MKTKSYFFIILLMVITAKMYSQAKINAYFDHLFSNCKFMGSVAVSHNDSIIYANQTGYSNAENKTPLNRDTKFRVGSITKTYTATLILKAVEEKKLKLNDKLSFFYPQVKNAEKITITHLLKHHSGIFNFTEIEDEGEWERNFHTEKEFIDYILKQPPVFEPGTNHEYSNTNYALLGFILQKVYKQPYAKILKDKITKPLQLKSTYYSPVTDVTKNEALSYNIQDRFLKNNAVNFSVHFAGGGIVSTPVELNKFLYALFNHKIINAESLKLMLPEKNGEYGMGIQKIALGSTYSVYEHGGRVENYISDYWYSAKDNLGIVVLSNAININIEEVLLTLLKSVSKKDPVLANFNATETVPENQFLLIKGTYYDTKGETSVTISSDGSSLVFQDSRPGQDFVPFEYTGNNTFVYENITLVFIPEKKEMHLTQGEVKNIYIKNPAK